MAARLEPRFSSCQMCVPVAFRLKYTLLWRWSNTVSAPSSSVSTTSGCTCTRCSLAVTGSHPSRDIGAAIERQLVRGSEVIDATRARKVIGVAKFPAIEAVAFVGQIRGHTPPEHGIRIEQRHVVEIRDDIRTLHLGPVPRHLTTEGQAASPVDVQLFEFQRTTGKERRFAVIPRCHHH